MAGTLRMDSEAIAPRRVTRNDLNTDESRLLHCGQIPVDGAQADRIPDQFYQLASREVTMRMLLEETAQPIPLFCPIVFHLRMIRKL